MEQNSRRRRASRNRAIAGNAVVCAVAVVLAGCHERPRGDANEEAAVVADLDCSAGTLADFGPGKKEMIRGYAVRIARYENQKNNVDKVKQILAVYDSGDLRALEKSVAEYFCADSARAVLLSKPLFPESGSVAPTFELMPLGANRGDRPVRLMDLKGSYVLLDFWAGYCVPCVEKYPAMEQLARDFSNRGVKIVAILYNEWPDQALRWFEQRGGSAYPVLVDPGGIVAARYQVTGIPRMFLIGPDGRILRNCLGCQFGGMSTDSLRSFFEQMTE